MYMYIYIYAFCSNFGSFICSFNGPLVKVLDSQSRGPCSKPLGGYKIDPAFHSSEVGKMSISNLWKLSGKK